MPSKLEPKIFNLLDAIHQRPLMYLRRRSLMEIETMLHGYSAALNMHNVQEAETDFNRRFASYLEKRFGWSSCQGWAMAIRRHSNPKNAFDRFFVLLSEYRKSHA